VEWTALDDASGQRFDHYLQAKLPQFSRSRLQDWIKAGKATVNGRPSRVSATLKGGEAIAVEPAAPRPLRAEAEDIPVGVLYEDPSVIAINKPAGMVVHAGAGVHSGTLVNALLHRFGALSHAGGEDRPGIVHRIDKETSGILIVARNDTAHQSLAAQFQSREVGKTYIALVQGVMRDESGHVDKPITRDPVRRTRMTCRLETGRAAYTEWRVKRRYAKHSLLEVTIHTGRTHQIRVHLSSIGHPILGDRLYGAAESALLPERFFLHAWRLRFRSPATGEVVTVEAPLARELAGIIDSELL